MDSQRSTTVADCRICGGTVEEFFDFGRQPVSDSFVTPETAGQEFYFRLAVGICGSCTMVQLLEEVPREHMFHEDYPYRSAMSSMMNRHFEEYAGQLLRTELTGPDPFIVEIGSNDGTMLKTLASAGVRHLGVDPSAQVADLARAAGVRSRTAFFEESTAREIAAADGPADVIFSANTTSHIPYLGSVFRGVDALLAPRGVLVLEDRHLGAIMEQNSFDQIYDEHFYLFSATSVSALARLHGFALVDVEPLAVHGGSMRYTIARAGSRTPSPAVEALQDRERAQGLTDPETYQKFGDHVRRGCAELMELLERLRAEGRTVVGYGATAKSATVINYCGIGPDLLPFICDSTPAKQGRLTPGRHIPVRPPSAFSDPYPDYAVLFAWNHAEEIMAKEQEFRDAGGRWILYVPDVHVV
ncbi:class I SAM-dependent methyltransferase [Streptomyces sp. LHD-70]|uniref:class I SAM-dependent methyltransferase n=1 Tax=Streptomyces sp. LHD-70 TaxID=3072140 RepID=UPI00280DC4A0|nr:class I SAM-dependent methyltransferase [Streptomyces sp. LHD-70]MDQ8706184.1 class I SAM-dependent methyltransferase [Streptomyces sp. LHD-70]